jgi:hypothetical protein
LTIAIALRCRDGIAICADREMSTPAFSYYERKISSIRLGIGELLLTQAGDVADMKLVHEQLSEKLEGSFRSPHEIREDLQTVLTAVIGERETITHEVLVAMCPNPGGAWGAGIGHNQSTLEGHVDIGSARVVWRSANDKIFPMLESWAMIGSGESALTHYLMAMLLKNTSDFAISQGQIYALYAVHQAKKYIHGVGKAGPIDVVSLTANGIVVVPETKVEAMEREFDVFEMQTSSLFSRFIEDCQVKF